MHPSLLHLAHGNIFRGREDGVVIMVVVIVVGVCGNVMNFHNIFCGGGDRVLAD